MSIEALQNELIKQPQVDIKTTHTFCSGVYAREITIPKGVCVIGAKHKTSFFMVISKGRCVIRDGDSKEEYAAPCTLISPVGAKRAIYAISETVLTTFHPTKHKSVEKIERDIIEPEGLKITNNKAVLECLG